MPKLNQTEIDWVKFGVLEEGTRRLLTEVCCVEWGLIEAFLVVVNSRPVVPYLAGSLGVRLRLFSLPRLAVSWICGVITHPFFGAYSTAVNTRDMVWFGGLFQMDAKVHALFCVVR